MKIRDFIIHDFIPDEYHCKVRFAEISKHGGLGRWEPAGRVERQHIEHRRQHEHLLEQQF